MWGSRQTAWVVTVVSIIVGAATALVFLPVARAAARSNPDHVVVRAAAVRNQRVLLHLLRAGRNLTHEPLLRYALPRSAARDRNTPGQAVAGVSRARQPFRILSDGYLPRNDYQNAVGRLYAVSANGAMISACTASVVGPNVVLTAAHCVHDPRTHHDYAGFLFVPGMRRSSAPVGTWTGSSSAYWSGWARRPRVSLDYAFVTLDPNQSGQNIGDVTGHFNIVEYARPRRVLAEGYPGTGPFSRNCTLTSCLATYCYSPLAGVFRGANGRVLAIGCVTGQGSSGGPWFVRFRHHWAIGSVTSIGLRLPHTNYFRAIFGPQFNSSLGRLLHAAENA
jgi:V8-like Glu-specific endopeptidase